MLPSFLFIHLHLASHLGTIEESRGGNGVESLGILEMLLMKIIWLINSRVPGKPRSIISLLPFTFESIINVITAFVLALSDRCCNATVDAYVIYAFLVHCPQLIPWVDPRIESILLSHAYSVEVGWFPVIREI